MIRKIKTIKDNDKFVATNFAELVEQFSHQRIVISNGQIFTGKDAVLKARQAFPNSVPLSLPVPGPEEFIHTVPLLSR